MTLVQRIKAPTPRFFRKVRNGSVASAGVTLCGLPVTLPLLLQQVMGYLVVAGTVAAAVCQTPSGGKPKKEVAHGH